MGEDITQEEWLENLVREFRDMWFWDHLASKAQERAWETEEEEERRKQRNKKFKAEYDEQTSRLIEGDPSIRIAPYCANDMKGS